MIDKMKQRRGINDSGIYNPYYTFSNLKFKDVGSLAQNQRLVLKLVAVGAGHCACPNEGNHRGIAPTKNGLQKNQSLKSKAALSYNQERAALIYITKWMSAKENP